MKIAISSGHGKIVRGAEDILDEVNEARLVVDEIANRLKAAGVGVNVFHDNTSTSQSENLDAICDWHNKQTRDLDISVHFNCYDGSASGTECLYVTQDSLAAKVAEYISAASGLKNRGAKKRTDLAFLNGTDKPAILIETCFVDSETDAGIYAVKFGAIVGAICEAVAGVPAGGIVDPPPTTPPPSGALFTVTGKASYFGGPNDEGVSRREGLAFISSIEQAPHLFLPYQPAGTIGLARRLNPHTHYIACRWDYSKTPKSSLLESVASVKAIKTGITLKAFPSDWGPHEDTGRVADLSPSLMEDLGIQTDDAVEVTLPA